MAPPLYIYKTKIRYTVDIFLHFVKEKGYDSAYKTSYPLAFLSYIIVFLTSLLEHPFQVIAIPLLIQSLLHKQVQVCFPSLYPLLKSEHFHSIY